MFTKALSAAVMLFALCGVAHAADNKPLDLSLPKAPLSDDWFAPRVTPTSTTVRTDLVRSPAQRQPRKPTYAINFDVRGDQLNSLRSLERRLTTFHYGLWDVRLKPRSSDRGSLEVTYRGLRCPNWADSCSLSYSGQRVSLHKFVRDSYEGREVSNFFVDKYYRRPYNPMFDSLHQQPDENFNIVMVTYRMSWR